MEITRDEETIKHPSYEEYKQLVLAVKLIAGDKVTISINDEIVKEHIIVNTIGDLGLTILDRNVKLTDELRIIDSQIDQLVAEKAELIAKETK